MPENTHPLKASMYRARAHTLAMQIKGRSTKTQSDISKVIKMQGTQESETAVVRGLIQHMQ